MSAFSNADSKECRHCHRIGTKQFVPSGSEDWVCSNDVACARRRIARDNENKAQEAPPQPKGHH